MPVAYHHVPSWHFIWMLPDVRFHSKLTICPMKMRLFSCNLHHHLSGCSFANVRGLKYLIFFQCIKLITKFYPCNFPSLSQLYPFLIIPFGLKHHHTLWSKVPPPLPWWGNSPYPGFPAFPLTTLRSVLHTVALAVFLSLFKLTTMPPGSLCLFPFRYLGGFCCSSVLTTGLCNIITSFLQGWLLPTSRSPLLPPLPLYIPGILISFQFIISVW